MIPLEQARQLSEQAGLYKILEDKIEKYIDNKITEWIKVTYTTAIVFYIDKVKDDIDHNNSLDIEYVFEEVIKKYGRAGYGIELNQKYYIISW